MFGDNMSSVISDTTIASISSQKANLNEKLKLNIKVAIVASAITVMILAFLLTILLIVIIHYC